MRFEIYVAAADEELAGQARALLDAVIADSGVDGASVETIRVASDDEARDLASLGSPTIRIEGYDVEYAEREPPERSNGARYYSTPGGWQRLPEPGMVRFAIDEARLRMQRA